MFEVGKLLDESLDSLITELDRIQRYGFNAFSYWNLFNNHSTDLILKEKLNDTLNMR